MPITTVLPKDSLVVVTGANGNVASHIVDNLLRLGYRVRGTVRSLKRSNWLLDYFGDKYGPGRIELAEVPDMSVPNAFDDAVKGAQGFIHTAAAVFELVDPNEISKMVDGTINVLVAAASEPGITRVVMTSSSGAATRPRPNEEFHIDANTWNYEDVKAAWAPPPYEGMERRMAVYYAIKTESERAAWTWVRENRPSFVFNTILPNMNFGPVMNDSQLQQSSPSLMRAVWDGFAGEQGAALQGVPPQYYVSFVDNALIHIAALLYSDVKDERLFAFAKPYNWNDILALFRKLYPERNFIDDIPNLERDLSTVANERAEELLRRISGHGWTSLEESAKQAAAAYK